MEKDTADGVMESLSVGKNTKKIRLLQTSYRPIVNTSRITVFIK